MTVEEKRVVLEQAIPEASRPGFRVSVEEKTPEVARFTIRCYNQERRRPDGGSA